MPCGKTYEQQSMAEEGWHFQEGLQQEPSLLRANIQAEGLGGMVVRVRRGLGPVAGSKLKLHPESHLPPLLLAVKLVLSILEEMPGEKAVGEDSLPS